MGMVPDVHSSSKELNLTWKLRLISAASRLFSFVIYRLDGTINRRLLHFLDRKIPPSDEPIDGVKTSDVTFDSSSNLWFRQFSPSSAAANNTSSLPLIVHFHGGGFVLGAVDSSGNDFLCRQIAAQVPAVVVSVNYRLAPEHRCPVQYEDGFSALKFIDDLQVASALPENVDLSRCYLAGDSAGGNIAHHVAVRSIGYSFRKVKIAGVVAIQPFFSGEDRTESEIRCGGGPVFTLKMSDSFWKMFLPEGSDRDHEAANVTGPNSKDLTEVVFPATLVVIGGHDLLQDAQKRYVEWLRKSGKRLEVLEIPSAFHGFYAFAHTTDVPEFSVLIKGIRDFISSNNRSSPSG